MVRSMETLHEFKNIFRAPLIQIPGRFIGEKQCWAVPQRPCNCYALLLAPGKLPGPLFGSTGQPHLCKPLTRRSKRLPQPYAPKQQRHRYIFRRREIRQKVMSLPDKTNGAIAILCQLRLGKRLERIPAEVYCTARWSVQRSQQVQQRTLARAGRACD